MSVVPAINEQDIPLDHWGHVHSETFIEICQYFNSIDVRQVMSTDNAVYTDAHLWKLFGCMYNLFGICAPVMEYIEQGYVYRVRMNPARTPF
jgi:hypothetical protein